MLPYFWYRDGWLSRPAPVDAAEYVNLPVQYSVGAASSPTNPCGGVGIVPEEVIQSMSSMGAPPPAPPD
jgi:hypothetical protein